MWLVATILASSDIEHFYYPRKFCSEGCLEYSLNVLKLVFNLYLPYIKGWKLSKIKFVMNTYKTSTHRILKYFSWQISHIVEIFPIKIFHDFTQGSNCIGYDSYKSLEFLCTLCALFMKDFIYLN